MPVDYEPVETEFGTHQISDVGRCYLCDEVWPCPAVELPVVKQQLEIYMESASQGVNVATAAHSLGERKAWGDIQDLHNWVFAPLKERLHRQVKDGEELVVSEPEARFLLAYYEQEIPDTTKGWTFLRWMGHHVEVR